MCKISVLVITFASLLLPACTQKTALPSLYNDQLVFTKSEPNFIPEIDFLLQIITIAHQKGWQGKLNEPIPVSPKDFDQHRIGQYDQEFREKTKSVVIPEIPVSMTDLKAIRQEYLAYAKKKGTAQKYIYEITNHILPEDRIKYYPRRGTSNVHVANQSRPVDYSQLEMEVYAEDIHKYSQECERSGIVGQNEKMCQDMALRYVMYHEMTHALQQSIDVVNAPPSDKKNLLPWLNASKSTLMIDQTHYQSWGSSADSLARSINNRTIAKESQAEGVAIAMVGDVFNLSDVQKHLLWEYHFGRLIQGKQDISQAFTLAQEQYPHLSLESFVHQFFRENPPIYDFQERLDGQLAIHLGYLNPMTPEETSRFWNYAKE